MGRHTHYREHGLPRTATAGVVATAAVVLLGAAAIVAPPDLLSYLPGGPDVACHTSTVRLVVEPELKDVVEEALAPLAGTSLPGGACLSTSVTAQEAARRSRPARSCRPTAPRRSGSRTPRSGSRR